MRFLSRLAILLVACACASSLRATTVEPMEFSELVNASDYIVRGRVKELRNEVRQQAGRELPFTLVEVEVLEVVAGTPPARVTLSLVGGRTPDGGELRVEGVPQFTVGDEEIFFVQGNGTNFYPTTAVMHGRYPVLFDKQLNRSYVARINRVPLAATAEIGLPLAEGKLAQLLRRQRRADDALTPAEFTASIRQARTDKKTSPEVTRAR